MDGLKGKVAIVTGGATLIGAAVVRAFHREGTKVVVADIDAAGGEALKADDYLTASGSATLLPEEKELVDSVKTDSHGSFHDPGPPEGSKGSASASFAGQTGYKSSTSSTCEFIV